LTHINVNIKETAIPVYLMARKAYLNSSAAKKNSPAPNTIKAAVIIKNLTHFNYIRNGILLNLIDQILEWSATPIVIAAFIKAINKYPT
jgi:hypothetical protein